MLSLPDNSLAHQLKLKLAALFTCSFDFCMRNRDLITFHYAWLPLIDLQLGFAVQNLFISLEYGIVFHNQI